MTADVVPEDYRGKAIFRLEDRDYFFEDVTRALLAAGVDEGETLMVHADISSFGKIADLRDKGAYARSYIDALLNVIGPSGNLVMPAFSHSFCRNEIFDPDTTPSSAGVLSEEFRKLPGVKRSLDAIFSVAVCGPEQEELTQVGTDCFGPGSIFEKLHQRDARMVFLGENFHMTYQHYVEQRLGVAYRFFKTFSGRIRLGGELVQRSFDYFVRPLDESVVYDVEKLARFLDSRGVLRQAPLGHSRIRTVGAVAAFEAIREGLREDPRLLLKA